MLPVGLAPLEREPVRPREAPVSFAYEKWVAAASRACATAAGTPTPSTSPAVPWSATNATARGLFGLTHPDACRRVRRHHHHWLQRSERAGSDRVDVVIAWLVVADAPAQPS
jgi:hypothetical protein